MIEYRPFSLAVPGGELCGGAWNPDAVEAATVLAVHGITASHRAWSEVADRVGGLRMLAPDLRGRGRSNSLPPPWGMRDHAGDLLRTLDYFFVDRAVVIGHSMGGFAAVLLAAEHPDRVSAVILVDGGLPLPELEGVSPADLPAVLLGPAGERLRQIYSSRDEYEAVWRQHPAFIGHWSDAVADYVQYDLDEVTGTTTGYRPSARRDAVATNIVQLGGTDGYREALASIQKPLVFLRAPRGLLDEPEPLYPVELVARAIEFAPRLRLIEADDVNHYTIVMTPHGAEQVAGLLAEAASGQP